MRESELCAVRWTEAILHQSRQEKAVSGMNFQPGVAGAAVQDGNKSLARRQFPIESCATRLQASSDGFNNVDNIDVELC